MKQDSLANRFGILIHLPGIRINRDRWYSETSSLRTSTLWRFAGSAFGNSHANSEMDCKSRIFSFFRRLTSEEGVAHPTAGDESSPREAGDQKAGDDFARLDSHAPLQDAANIHHSFVRREAVLNRSERIAGYEFSLMTSLHARIDQEHNQAKQAYDAALLAKLSIDEVESLLGPRIALINLSAKSLNNALIQRLPPRNTVLIVDAFEQTNDADELSNRQAELKALGFSLGLNVATADDAITPLLGQADFVQIDVSVFDGLDLRTLIRHLKKTPPTGEARFKLIGRNISTYDDFQFCKKCGFDLFHGKFISSHESLGETGGRINRAVLLPILSMLRNDGNYASIADELRNEPVMSYKLLRYINSAAAGLQRNIDNLTEALMVIGREKFYRWISLLLFDFSNPSYQERLLAERSLGRGRALELMAGKGNIPNDPDHLFLVGLFSLIDKAIGRPLPELLEKAALPPVVRNALTEGSGAYADALSLTILGEADASPQPDQMASAFERCQISDTDYLHATSEALIWAHDLLDEERKGAQE